MTKREYVFVQLKGGKLANTVQFSYNFRHFMAISYLLTTCLTASGISIKYLLNATRFCHLETETPPVNTTVDFYVTGISPIQIFV